MRAILMLPVVIMFCSQLMVGCIKPNMVGVGANFSHHVVGDVESEGSGFSLSTSNREMFEGNWNRAYYDSFTVDRYTLGVSAHSQKYITGQIGWSAHFSSDSTWGTGPIFGIGIGKPPTRDWDKRDFAWSLLANGYAWVSSSGDGYELSLAARVYVSF